MPASTLVLSDIDGTLVRRAGPHHKQALVEAVRRVTGFETSFDNLPTEGMLDRDLIYALLREVKVGRARVARAMPDIIAEAQRLYVESCPDLRRRACPGARSLLRALYRAQIPAGLVTGNLTAIGWKKIEQAGLRQYFEFGAFSDMARTRAGLARAVISTARRTGVITRTAQVSLIGDHMNDVQAAKLNGIRSIAVATGIATVEDLAAVEPDLLVPDLRSVRLQSLLP